MDGALKREGGGGREREEETEGEGERYLVHCACITTPKEWEKKEYFRPSQQRGMVAGGKRGQSDFKASGFVTCKEW